jgi:hypothetical protein
MISEQGIRYYEDAIEFYEAGGVSDPMDADPRLQIEVWAMDRQ